MLNLTMEYDFWPPLMCLALYEVWDRLQFCLLWDTSFGGIRVRDDDAIHVLQVCFRLMSYTERRKPIKASGFLVIL